MNLRDIKHEKGFYLKSRIIGLKEIQISTHTKKKRSSRTNNEINRGMKSLNCKVLSKLISTTSRSPLVRGDMELSPSMYKYLHDKYDLKGRYKGIYFYQKWNFNMLK